MADFAPLKSTEYTAYTATPPQLAGSYRWGSKLRASSASLTFTSAGATGTADAHIGYAAHVSGTTGAAVVADDNAFLDNSDIGGSAIDSAFVLPAVGYLDLDSADGVLIQLMIDTAASPATGECWVCVVYQQGN